MSNKDSLTELLSTTWPEITEYHVSTPTLRGKGYKRSKDSLEKNELLAEVDAFYQNCVEEVKKRKKQKTRLIPLKSLSRSELPRSFYVKDTCDFLVVEDLEPKLESTEEKQVAAPAAAHCINARGAIAHGKETALMYTIEYILDGDVDGSFTVRNIFDRLGGGAKILDTIKGICEELTKNGPVVSTSFFLDESFASKHPACFCKDRIGKNHEIVLVGWKETEDGDMWITEAPLQSKFIDGVSTDGLITTLRLILVL